MNIKENDFRWSSHISHREKIGKQGEMQDVKAEKWKNGK
jgi:hypothetical protein